MTTTITHDMGTLIPVSIEDYSASRPARSVVHTILGRSNPDITFREPGLRVGTLQCVFASQEDALAAYGVFSAPQVLALENDEIPSVDMSFVVAEGDIEITIDPDTAEFWTIAVPFVEVTP